MRRKRRTERRWTEWYERLRGNREERSGRDRGSIPCEIRLQMNLYSPDVLDRTNISGGSLLLSDFGGWTPSKPLRVWDHRGRFPSVDSIWKEKGQPFRRNTLTILSTTYFWDGLRRETLEAPRTVLGVGGASPLVSPEGDTRGSVERWLRPKPAELNLPPNKSTSVTAVSTVNVVNFLCHDENFISSSRNFAPTSPRNSLCDG